MMHNYIYRITVEVEPMEGTQLPAECAGAFVSVYLGENNIINAIQRAESELLKDCYKPVHTSSAYELDLEEDDFDTEERGYPNNSDLANIKATGTVWYGPFHTYPPEENQIQ